MGGATLTSERTWWPTSSCPVAPPCTLVLLTACRRRSLLLLPPPSRSRSLLPLSASTPYGSVAPSWLPSPPSRPCGSPRKNTTNQAPALSTASASKCKDLLQLLIIHLEVIYGCISVYALNLLCYVIHNKL